MSDKIKIDKPGILYRLFKAYIRFFHNLLYYRRTYSLRTDRIPPNGTPLLIVSNHQNCLNDPLGILFALRDRKPAFMLRADLFAMHPLFSRFLFAIGLLPAFRIDYEGEEALGKNRETFLRSEHELLHGRTVVMYPEAGHQDKHRLGTFSFGYTRLAFEAAELGGFRTEIFILPSCNHYSDYFHIQEDMLVKFGTPVSLKPYYELYQTKPRTAQREVNAIVRRQIEELMLDVRDLKNYPAIDFLREIGREKQTLPEQLLSDRALAAALAQAYATDPETVQSLYDDALTLREGLRKQAVDLRLLDRPLSWSALMVRSLGLILGAPAWIVALWPNALHLIGPALILRRMNDKMFYGTVVISLNILVSIPVLYTLTLVLTWLHAGLWIALIYVAALPYLGLFAWYYRKFFLETLQAWRYHIRRNTEALLTLGKLKTSLYNRLYELFIKKNNK
jgi:1-acyl-sn-glycerol-3-phosphate acyltransferase